MNIEKIEKELEQTQRMIYIGGILIEYWMITSVLFKFWEGRI